VDLEADAVAQPMAEVLAVAGIRDHRAGLRIDGDTAESGGERVQPRDLRRQHQLVDLARLGGRLADGEGPRAVRAVAVADRADVNRHERARDDRRIARLRVRQRGERTAGDDRIEARAAGPAHAHLVLELDRDIALPAPGEAPFEQPFVDPVNERRGRRDPLDLLGLLDRAEAFDQAAARDQFACGRCVLLEPCALRNGRRRVIEADPSRRQRRSHPDQRVVINDLAGERAFHLDRRLLLVAEVGEESRLSVGRHQRHTARAGEAAEVADIRATVHDQRREVALDQQLAEPLDAGALHPSSSLLSRTSASR